MWEWEDSNLRTLMRTDLQSVAIATMRRSHVEMWVRDFPIFVGKRYLELLLPSLGDFSGDCVYSSTTLDGLSK